MFQISQNFTSLVWWL